MIDGVNDSPEQAELLARRVKPLAAHVNLIPLNNVAEKSYRKSSAKSIEEFTAYLEKHHITATVRRKLGSDINASCGQLRKQHMQKDTEEPSE